MRLLINLFRLPLCEGRKVIVVTFETKQQKAHTSNSHRALKRIIFTFPVYASFVRNDKTLLKKYFLVSSFHFSQEIVSLPFSFVKQFIFLSVKIRNTACLVSFFAGYSSLLPALFAKVFGKPHLIILGGTDCTSFPSIGYGNFQKKLLGWFTCKSLKMATHLSPVDESLIDCEYSYTENDFPRQGFKNFCKEVSAPVTTVHIGYDPSKFFKSGAKRPNSFLTVAQMNAANFFRKGIDLIFEIALLFPQCTFTIVGNTDEMKYENIPPNLKLLPFVPYEKLRDVYSAHEFYFQLSIMEGFPSAPCEAMLCECIPITSNAGALPLIVGDAGFILKKKNSLLLKTLIEEALRTDRKAVGEKARRHIIEKFPPHERYKLIELINSL